MHSVVPHPLHYLGVEIIASKAWKCITNAQDPIYRHLCKQCLLTSTSCCLQVPSLSKLDLHTRTSQANLRHFCRSWLPNCSSRRVLRPFLLMVMHAQLQAQLSSICANRGGPPQTAAARCCQGSTD
eukprot:scaffold136074_cov19-Tisochrysis_lutea.AAC.1